MALDLTALTEREIVAEETASGAGHCNVAALMRVLFRHAHMAHLLQQVCANEEAAARCRAQPQRFVVPAGEPIEPDPGDVLRRAEAGGEWA